MQHPRFSKCLARARSLVAYLRAFGLSTFLTRRETDQSTLFSAFLSFSSALSPCFLFRLTLARASPPRPLLIDRHLGIRFPLIHRHLIHSHSQFISVILDHLATTRAILHPTCLLLSSPYTTNTLPYGPYPPHSLDIMSALTC